jgi:hypothetical protein
MKKKARRWQNPAKGSIFCVGRKGFIGEKLEIYT